MTSRDNPFEPLNRMFEQMSDQLRDAARTWETGGPFDVAMTEPSRMTVDVLDENDQYTVKIDVPGFDREDVEVRVDDQVLYVETEHDATVEAADERYVRREREHRSSRRTVSFPTPIDTADVEATMARGVLTVTVAKAEPLEEGTSIEIEDD
jgi:HSP20 family protein